MRSSTVRDGRVASCLLLSAALLAACGGSDGDPASAVTAAPATPVADIAQPTADPTTAPNAPANSATSSTPTPPSEATILAAPAMLADATTSSTTTATAPGSGYFVDALNGDDASPGTFERPWRSLAKLTRVVLQPGQNMYLRCGSVWRESLRLTWSQLQDNTQIVGYGDCARAKATISGAERFTGGWTKNGNVWSRPLPAGTPRIGRLFVNGATMRAAQWPNFQGIGNEFAIAHPDSPVTTASLRVGAADLPVLAGREMVGATIHVRADSYHMNERTITAFDTASGTMTLNAAEVVQQMEGGDGYVLQGKLWMLDAPGEWYHDLQRQMLYVVPPTAATQADFNTANVEGSVRDTALEIVNRRGLIVKNLALVRARVDGLFINEAPSAIVRYVDASENGRSGVQVKLGAVNTPPAPARGATITNSTFLNNWVYGVFATFSRNVDLIGNHVKQTGTIGWAGQTYAAIGAGPGMRVELNHIEGAAFNGIVFNGTGGTRIVNNDITGYCLRLSDCAAIYTWNGPLPTTAQTNQSSLIEGNRIGPGKANIEGAVGSANEIVVGIYLDDYARGATVRNNIVVGTPMGIYVHNGSNHTVTGNKVWLTRRTALWANMNYTAADLMTGNVWSDNELAPVAAAGGTFPALPEFPISHAFWFRNAVSGFGSLSAGGSLYSGNRVIQLQGAGVPSAWVRDATRELYLTHNGWRSMNGGEPAARAPMTFAPYSLSLGGELLSGGGFDSGIAPWNAALATLGIGSIGSTSGSGCSGLCVAYNAGNVLDMLNSPGFALDGSRPHVLSYEGSYHGTARVRPWIGRNTSPWDAMAVNNLYTTFNSTTGSAGDTIRHELFFMPKGSATARANVQMATVGVRTDVDSVSLRPLLGYSVSHPSQYAAAAFAHRDAPRTIHCADLGWPSGCNVVDGSSGQPVSMPVTLPTGSGMLFLRADSPWRR